MGTAISKIGDGLWNAFLMAWEVWWALVLGFFISAVVQAWVPRERVESALADEGVGSACQGDRARARRRRPAPTQRSPSRAVLFAKGAGVASALAFQFASTNLVWELGLVLWVLIGWQFALAEFVGGIVMILLMWALLRLFVSRRLEQQAREHARLEAPAPQQTVVGAAELA